MKRYLPHGLFALVVLGLAFAQAQSINKSFQLSQDPTGVFNTDTSNNAYFPAHLNTTGLQPTFSGFGNAPTPSGSDMSGSVFFSTSATSGNLKFAQAYNSTPYCVASASGPTAVGAAPTPQGISFTFGTINAGGMLFYSCQGRAAN